MTTSDATSEIFFFKQFGNNDNYQPTQLDDEHNACRSGKIQHDRAH
jgi:hypothetical protein